MILLKYTMFLWDLLIAVFLEPRILVGPLKFKGENLCLESDNACGVLNEYFASVYTKEKPMKDGEITVEDISLKSRRWWWWVS